MGLTWGKREIFCCLTREGERKNVGERTFSISGVQRKSGRNFWTAAAHTVAAGNGDAHFKNFSLVPTPLGDHVLSPAYDLVNTRLHLPQESALALELFADDFETESFRENGFHRREDFRELARRFRLKPERAEGILGRVGGLHEKAALLVDASLLSTEAREVYRRILADRAGALAAH